MCNYLIRTTYRFFCLRIDLETMRLLIFFFFITSGKWTNHKGRSRRFTNPEELEEERKREIQERGWRKNHRGNDDESSSEEEKPVTKGDKSNSEDESESDSESGEDSDDVSCV